MPRLRELGEKKMVELLLAKIGSTAGIGPGDDAAALPIGDRYLVVSTDLIAQRTHMPPCMSAYQKGWMAAAVNLSDIAAMGAEPLGVVMAYGLPRETDADDLLAMAQGVKDCCEGCSSEYLGGDTKEAPEIVIAGTSLGLVRKDGILRRCGARSGDKLALIGTIGHASAGFAELGQKRFNAAARLAALQPMPRIKEGVMLSASGAVTSCMDTSDGLAMSVHELAKASGVGFRIDEGTLPYDGSVLEAAERLGMDHRELAIYGGGDYELLFTIDPAEVERLKGIMGRDMTIIGEATTDGAVTIFDGSGERPLPRKGYEHFKG
ncbi:MAG: thiamine monophosphate kinase [Methanomassiliicoccales archaeon PtaU1.Bin124]|nr:MAG: thiamine monophosphate kinase [Methanomassiliicoccales archaeon PtaU1.Bin124]